MAGKIFVNYRRGDDPGNTGRLYDSLEREFPKSQLFMDVEGHIRGGDDFVDVLKEEVARCDVFLAIIGPRWLEIADELGRRRLDNAGDWVRIEIASALMGGKRVIPVLVGGAGVPRAEDLPDDLKPLARRQALIITLERFKADSQGLVRQIRDALHEAERRTPVREAQPDNPPSARRASVLTVPPTPPLPPTANMGPVTAKSSEIHDRGGWPVRRIAVSLAAGAGLLSLAGGYLWLAPGLPASSTSDRYTVEETRSLRDIMSAFGGVSPIVGRDELMSAQDPKFVRFRVNFNDPVLQASKTVSHPQSAFLVENRLQGLDKSDPRDTMAHFVLGKDYSVKIVLQIGYAGRNYKTFIARFEHNGVIADAPLTRLFDTFYVVADRPFDRLTIFGDQPSEGTKLYGLQSTPRLNERNKFFQAIKKSLQAR